VQLCSRVAAAGESDSDDEGLPASYIMQKQQKRQQHHSALNVAVQAPSTDQEALPATGQLSSGASAASSSGVAKEAVLDDANSMQDLGPPLEVVSPPEPEPGQQLPQQGKSQGQPSTPQQPDCQHQGELHQAEMASSSRATTVQRTRDDEGLAAASHHGVRQNVPVSC
jgi:hypothetical protein